MQRDLAVALQYWGVLRQGGLLNCPLWLLLPEPLPLTLVLKRSHLMPSIHFTLTQWLRAPTPQLTPWGGKPSSAIY